MIVGRVNSKYIYESFRLNSDFHLTEGVVFDRLFRLKKHEELGAVSKEIFCGGRSKRVYVKKEYGIPYLGNTDISSSNPFSNCNYTSRKSWKETKGYLKEGMILTGRVGQNTVGAYSFALKDLEGAIGSDNVIRIISNGKVKNGYLYSFLASKFGYHLSRRHISGNAQPFITEDMLAEIPIPIFTEPKQLEIHNLILEASSLRVEANRMLSEAVEYFNSLKINYKYGTATSSKISINGISTGYKRFDSAYAIVSKLVEDSLQDNNIEFVSIRSQSSGIFMGPRSKRNYVNSGTPFLSTSAMQKANPTKTDKFISPKSTDGFIVKEGWILTTRSGTLGDTIYTLPCIDGYAVSEDAIRVVLKDGAQISNKYLFAFLKSSIGKSSLLSGSYGSVIVHLNESYIGDVKVPLLDDSIIKTIESKVAKHLENINEAILKENEAIDLVEKEIESWQK